MCRWADIQSKGPTVRRTRALIPLLAIGTVVLAVTAPATPSGAAVGTSATIAPIRSDDGADLAAKKKQIADALATAQATYEAAGSKVQAAAEAYATATAELPGAQSELAQAQGRVVAASVALDRARAQVVAAQAAVTAADQSLAAASDSVTRTQTAIAAIAATAYEGSNMTEINVLMNPGSPTDVLTRLSLLSEVQHRQNAVLGGYQNARLIAAEAYSRSVAAETAAKQAKKNADKALATSRRAQETAQAAADSVTHLVAATRTALGIAQQNKAATLAAYQQLQVEEDAVEKQLAAQAAADAAAAKASRRPPISSHPGPVAGTSGYFIMPIHGWKSSNFGWRFDPFYKRWQLHAGVDIAAPGGTPIHAAGSGRIIRAGRDGGYGNYTCIDNGAYNGPGPYRGKGVATCYGHQSVILVHPGEYVRQGQIIGRVGETGAATGFHLHFEVRINGRAVQPLNWLPVCFC
jgi:murein DD-endopeptidase MepM/ murein hydrolase activator NlpD